MLKRLIISVYDRFIRALDFFNPQEQKEFEEMMGTYRRRVDNIKQEDSEIMRKRMQNLMNEVKKGPFILPFGADLHDQSRFLARQLKAQGKSPEEIQNLVGSDDEITKYLQKQKSYYPEPQSLPQMMMNDRLARNFWRAKGLSEDQIDKLLETRETVSSYA